ncbi:MAG: aldehyde dehydrogenase family protein [Candidatus Nanopelagicales bacterium]
MTDPRPAFVRQVDRVAGEELAPAHVLAGWLCNPSSGEPLAQQAATDLAVVERAIATADRIDREGTWRDLPVEERCAHLERVAAALDTRAEEIGVAESTCTGVVISVARLFGGALAGSFRDAAAQLRDGWIRSDLGEDGRPVELLRIPWGPTVILVPWNAPAAMAAKKVANALAVGAPVILKPPEWAPFGCNLLADAIAEAGLPAGVFQMVHGGPEVGRALTTDPRIRAVAFTGSVATGRRIALAGAEDFKALQLELGGNNPVIVREDADVHATAVSLAQGMVKLNGQWCEGPGKILVARALHDALVAELLAQLASYAMGAHDDEDAQLGPISHQAHRDLLDAQVRGLVEKGATVTEAGPTPDLPGWFWAPRLITGADPADAVEELFGPVVTVHPVDSDDEAVRLANDSPYGLAGYVFGTDTTAAMSVGRRIRFGEVKVNGTSLLDLSPHSVQSFWRNSGLGGHGNEDVFRFFCGAQIVGVDRSGLPI